MKILILTFSGLFLGAWSLAASASTEMSLSAKLVKCGDVALPNERLACFDDLLAKTSVVKKPTPIVQTQPKKSKDVDDFAKEHLKKTSADEGLDSITSTIRKLKKLIRGQWVISLENGQQWQQKGGNKIKLKVGDTIRMEKGAMGVVYLYKEGSNRNIRVKRLK